MGKSRLLEEWEDEEGKEGKTERRWKTKREEETVKGRVEENNRRRE